jgi:Domain of unknown function (DUF4439)
MTETDALQTTLAAEHAAVYVYGALGGRTSRSASPELFAAVSSAYAAHRGRRDQLTADIADAGDQPVAAEAAYDLPGPLLNADQINRAALDLERSCATTYAYLVASTVADERRWAIAALTDSAVRQLSFAGAPETFPGIADSPGDQLPG